MNSTTLLPACAGHIHTDRGTRIIVIKNGLIAVSRRLDYSHALQFPGGHVEPDESCVAATLRELHEETGLTVAADRIQSLFHHLAARSHSGAPYKACGFLLELNPDEELNNPEPHKHTDWMWMTVDQLELAGGMIPSTVRCLNYATANHASRFAFYGTA